MNLRRLFRTSGSHFRSLVELNPDITVINCDGKIVFINRAGAQALGVENPDELIGRSVMDFIHPDNRYVINKRVPHPQNQGQTIPQAEEKLVRLDGSVICVETTAMPITYQGRQATLVIGHDITARKNIEDELAEQEHRFRAFTESTPDAILIVDYHTNILSWSIGAEKLFGYTKQEIIGKPSSVLLPAGSYREGHEQGVKLVHETASQGKLNHLFESVGLKKDGTHVPIEISISLFETTGGTYYGAVIIRDITARRQNEKLLTETNSFLDSIIENSPDGIVVADIDGVIIRINSWFANLLGYHKDECIGKYILEFFPHTPDTYEAVTGDTVRITEEFIVNSRTQMMRLFDEGTALNFETYLIRKDRRVIPVAQNVSLLYDRAGDVRGAFGILRDISSHKQLVKELHDQGNTLRTLINAAPESLFMIDIDGTVIIANEELARRLGTTVQELIGSNIYRYLPENLRASRRMFAEQALGEQKMIYYEDVRQERCMAHYVHPLPDESSSPNRVAVFSWDITEHKRAEEELRRHRDHLDELVKEKTAELIRANEKLQQEIALHLQVEQALRDSEQNFRSLVELSPDGIGIEQDDIVLFINSAGLKILGAESPEQIIGRQVIELVHPDYRKTVRDRISQVTTHGIISPFVEMQFVRLDGSAVDVELGSTACFYQNKSAAQAVFRDITRRKIVEQALLESEDKFRMLAETTASAIVIFQRTGIAYANPAAESLCGYTLEELKSLNFWEVIPPDYRERFKDSGMKRLRGEEMPAHFELPILTKNNETRWIDYTAAVIDYQGAKAVLGTGVDITSRKQAEDALRKSEEQYRMLVENSNSIILRMDRNGVVSFINEFAQKFFGYAAKDIVGRSVVGTIVPETDSSGRDLAFMIQDIGQRPELYTFNQNENMRCTGERVWIAWTNKVLFDENGQAQEILCIGNDITLLKQAEEKLLAYQKQLQSLASELSLAEERERRRIAVDLHDRIAQSLAFARIKIDTIKSSCGSAELGRMLTEVAELLGQTIQETRSLTIEICPPILYELGLEAALEWLSEQTQSQYGIKTSFANDRQEKPLDDEIRVVLFQAARELLVNVAKHAQADTARLSVERRDNQVRINVEDDGIGFDMAAAEATLGSNGGGFGLFSIRERLKHLGGCLECSSQAGQGTRISMIAPLKNGGSE